MRLAFGGSDAFASFSSLAPSGMKVRVLHGFFPAESAAAQAPVWLPSRANKG
jgi:hypothetical protein